MQHALSTPLTYPGSCKTCFFHVPVFGRKRFLIFLIIIIDLTVDLKLICRICLTDLINSLIFANSCPGTITHFGGFFSSSMVSWLLNFNEYFEVLLTLLTLHLNRSVMPKPVYLLTVQEAHKEYNSLTDLIWAKYKQLDSGKYWAVGTPAFNAESCELANLLARVSQLCQKLNLPPPKEL